MKKKFLAIILGGAIILGTGTLTFAATNDGDGKWSFEKMLPFMQEMHPDLSKNELKQMFDDCHGKGGMMHNFK